MTHHDDTEMNRAIKRNHTLDQLSVSVTSMDISDIQRKYDDGLHFNSNDMKSAKSVNSYPHEQNDLFWCIQCKSFTDTEIIDITESHQNCLICFNNHKANKENDVLWSQCIQCQRLYCLECALKPNNYKFMHSNNNIQKNKSPASNQIKDNDDTDTHIQFDLSPSKISNQNNSRKRGSEAMEQDDNSSNHHKHRPLKRRKMNQI